MTTQVPPLEREIEQHIAWIRIYADDMTSGDWRDMALRIKRQVDRLEEAVKAESTRAAQAEAREVSLFDAIAHGDEQHKTWLKEAIRAHFAGETPPAPYGKGITETLKQQLAQAEAAQAVLVGALEEALPLVDAYGCQTPVGHIATDCETVVALMQRARAHTTEGARRLLDVVEAAREAVLVEALRKLAISQALTPPLRQRNVFYCLLCDGDGPSAGSIMHKENCILAGGTNA